MNSEQVTLKLGGQPREPTLREQRLARNRTSDLPDRPGDQTKVVLLGLENGIQAVERMIKEVAERVTKIEEFCQDLEDKVFLIAVDAYGRDRALEAFPNKN